VDALATARLLLLASVLPVLGLSAFALYALNGREQAARTLLPLRGMIAACAAVGLAATILGFLAIAASMTGTPLGSVDGSTMAMVLGETAVGKAITLRTAALLAVLATALLAPLTPTVVVALLGGAIATASIAWGGHAMMLEGAAGWVHLVSDIVHLFAAAIWIGALIGLLRLLPRTGGDGASPQRVALSMRLLERFSFLGTFVVAAIALTGVVSSYMILGLPAPATLLGGAYGRMLAGKIALFVAVLGLASANRFLLTPLLAAPGRVDRGLGWLRLSIGAETALVAAILVIVSFLGMTEP
jgi:putative copper resistance protein D